MSTARAPQSQWFLSLLRCPDCAQPLSHGEQQARCDACGFDSLSARDLRSQRPRDTLLRFSRGPAISPEEVLRAITLSPPDITFIGPQAGRDSRELMSEIANRLLAGGDVLDLGCGQRDQAAPLEQLGFRYVGLDYDTSEADLLADAHSIPFADASFDCILSYAVLEHLHNPFIALQEAARVLRPGGWLVGTVSQGEPFHSSYFHHTPWALVSLLKQTPDLELQRLWPSSDTLGALARMGRYPRVLKLLLRCIDNLNRRLPWLAPRKMQWPPVEKQLDRLYRAGSICFAIQKSPVTGKGGA